MGKLINILLILTLVAFAGCKAGGGGPIRVDETSGSGGGGSDRDDGAISESPVKLAYSIQPVSTFENSNIQPGFGIVVLLQDAYGNTVNSNLPVTLAFANDASGGSATLNGTLTQNAVGGVATFTDISIDTSGNSYTFNATSPGLLNAVSSSFDIFVNTASQLVFTTDPTSTTAGSNISSIVVEIQDPSFVTVPINTQITLSFANDASGGSATLGGTLTTTSINGVATFSDINIDKAAAGYTLTASTFGPLTPDTSTAFNITPGAISNVALTVTGAGNIDADGVATTTLQATVTDAYANPISGQNVTLNIPVNGGSTTNPAVTNGSGVASWTLTSSNTAGTYAYTATAGAITSSSVNVVFDPTILLVTINQRGIQPDPDTTLPIEFDIVFSDPITPGTFTTADITQNGTATGVTWNLINLGDNRNYTLQATTASSGTIVPSIAANMVSTPNAILNTASTSTDNSVTYIPAVPVTINQQGAQADPTASTPILFDVVFGEAINPATFTTADITQGGSATGVTWNIINSGDNTNFTLQATGVTTDGTIVPSMAANVVQTTLGANNSSSTATDNSVTYRTKINVTVNQNGANPDPDDTLPANFDVVFSEAIDPTTFTTGDITHSGSATGVTWNIINSGDNRNFTLQATATTSSGTLIPSLANGIVSTTYGATNNASSSTDNSITFAPLFNVTINQQGAQADPTAAVPIQFDVVFSEAINSGTFTTADIVQNGTATGITWNIINSGDDTNFTLQATAITGDGTVVPSINATTINSAVGGNNNASSSTDNSVTYKTTFNVTVNQQGAQADPTASTPVQFDIVFSEAINSATFTTADITQNGTATGITWNIINSGDDTNFTLQATAITGDGTVIPSIAGSVVQTSYGANNNASTSTDNSVLYNTTFSVTINQQGAQADPSSALPIQFDVVFGEAVDATTFTTADITQNGTASGVTWNIINSGDNINFTLQATAATSSGTIIPSIALNLIQTSYGANNTASTATDNSVTYIPPFDVTINQQGAQADPTAAVPIQFDVVFSEAINSATFTTADITQNGTATGITWNIINSGDDTNFTLQATAITTDGTVIPSIAANIVQTTPGANNNASTSTDNSVTYNTTFNVTINQQGAQADPTASTPVQFDVVFSEAINAATFTAADITQNGTATGITWNIINSGDDTNFTLQATAITGDGTVIPTLNSSVVQSPIGGNNNASTSTDNSVLYNTTFTVTVNQQGAQADPSSALPIQFDVVFGEAVDATTFTTADITQNGTASGITWNIINSGDSINFTLQATAATSSGTIIPSIAINQVQTTYGANNLASTATDNSVTYIPPFDVTVNQQGAQADPTAATPVQFDVVFSEAIDATTFTAADITQNGTATGITWNIINSGDNINFTLQATAITGDGTVIPSIAANTIQTTPGANNNASTSTDNSVLYNTSFTVTVNQQGAQADPTASTPVQFDIVFGEAIDATTFTTADITQNGTATGITWNIINSGDDTNFTLQATAITGDGTVIPSLAGSVVQTSYGANNAASTSTDNSVLYNTTFTVTVNQQGAQADPTSSFNILYDVVFSEAVDATTFTTADITQNGTATGVTWNIINSGDNINFTLQATGASSSGTIIPSIAINLVQTTYGANNLASTATDNSVSYTPPFTAVINQQGAQADPTASTPVQFDVVFGEAISAATFTTADITQNGTATGITWNIINSGDDTNFTLQATAITGDGTVIPSIGANLVQTALGGNNTASTSTDNSVLYNTTFDVTVNQQGAQADPTASTPVQFDVVFTEAIDGTTFTTADITQNGTATGVTWNIINSGDSINFTLQATAITGDGTIIPSIAGSTVQTTYGANNNASTSTDNSVLYNTTFTVTVNQTGAQADPTSSFNIQYDVVFGEAIDATTFTTADITQNGTATGITWNIINSGDNINFTLEATAASSSGTIVPSIAVNQVQTTYGANNLVSTSTDNSVAYTPPFTAVINQQGAQADPTASTPVQFDVVFGEPISAATFTTADITQNGTATGITWNIINSGDDTNFTLQATAVTGDGTIIPSIGANLVQTALGGNNTASTSTDNSVLFNTTFTVTVNQQGAQADPTAATPVQFDVVFSEAIDGTTFTTADITQNGTATGITWNIINSGDSINFTLQATAITGDGTVIPSIAGSAVQTTYGANNNASTSTDNSVLYNTTFTATVNQKGAQADPSSVFNIQYDVVFGEAIDATTFTTADITQNGTATGVTWNIINSGDNINFTLEATAATSSGTIVPSLASSVVQTTYGANNLASTSTDNSVAYTPPFTVTVNQQGGQADPTASTPVQFTVVFGEAISAATFTTADITQNGTATGITWNIINSGDDINFTLQATAVTGDGTIIPSIGANLVQTALGGNNTASTSTDNSVLYNTTFTVSVNQQGAQADPTASTPVQFDVIFSEAIDATTFTAADVTQNGTATGITWNIINSGDSINFTLQATAVTGDGTVIPSLGSSVIQTTYGANNNASTSTDNSVLHNTTFTVTVNQKGAQADPATAMNVQFDVVFSENVDAATFTTADITQNGTATGVTWNIINSGDDTNFTLEATAATSEGTIIPSIASSAVQTTYGANNNASTSTDNSVTYIPPFTVTVNQKGAQADPTASTPVQFDVVFGTAINAATFTTADITQNGTATGVTWSITPSGDNINFTLEATAITGDGTVIPSIAANAVQTTLGANNSASTATDNTVTYNATITVTINQAGGQADPTSSLPASFAVVFEEAINAATFTTADITHSGTASGITWNIVNSGDNINFTVQATVVTVDGTLIPSINASGVSTSYGAVNTASTSTDNSVTYVPPFNATVNQNGGQADPTSKYDVVFDVYFSAAINAATFTTADITQNGTAAGITWTITNSGDNQNFTLKATAMTTDGTVIPSIAADMVQTAGGSNNLVSTSTDNTVTFTFATILEWDRTSFTFPTGVTHAEPFTITNTGSLTSGTLAGVSRASGNGAKWNILNDLCKNITLAPGASCTVDIEYTGGSTPGGSHSASFDNTDGVVNTLTPLACDGVTP